MTDPQIIALAVPAFIVAFSIGWNLTGWIQSKIAEAKGDREK
jgi:uncharacterized membrane protein